MRPFALLTQQWHPAGAVCGTQAATYTWTGGSAVNDNWDTFANWIVSQIGVPCYPSDSADDVIISGTFDVDLINEAIDALTVSGDIDFGAVSGTPTLYVNAITISGGTGGSTISMSGASIIAQ